MYIVAYEPYERGASNIFIEICKDEDDLWAVLVDDLDLIPYDEGDYTIDENGIERPRFVNIQDIIDYLTVEFVGDGSFSVVSISIFDGTNYLLQE